MQLNKIDIILCRLPSLLSVVNFAISHNCWLYVLIAGVRIVKGPVAISDGLERLSLDSNDFPSISVVLVIGGPKK